MPEHDRSHPQWVVPTAGTAPEPGDGAPGPVPAEPGARLAAPRLGRALVAVGAGLLLLLGGGAAGAALAAEGGLDLGGAVPTAGVGDGPDGPDGRGDGPGRGR
jgi:hypothetical protein